MDDIKELKARAYDLIGHIEGCRAELQQVNMKIAELAQKNGNNLEVVKKEEAA